MGSRTTTTTEQLLPIILAELVNESQEALLALSLDGRALVWNRGAEELFGYTAQEVLGQVLAELIIPADLSGDDLRTEALHSLVSLAAGTRRVQTTARRKDGIPLNVDLSLRLVDRPGTEPYVAVSARDV